MVPISDKEVAYYATFITGHPEAEPGPQHLAAARAVLEGLAKDDRLIEAPSLSAAVASEDADAEAGPMSTAVTAALRNWALMYPIPAWGLAHGDQAERLAGNWARVASGMVLEALASEHQWGVRTTYTDGSQGIDWSDEEEARSFLLSYSDYDAEPHMHVRTRELVRRPIVAGEIEVSESDYDTRRQAADGRVKNRRVPTPKPLLGPGSIDGGK
jgi:hypothetical protein